MQGGTCQEASTAPALPPPPRTWMQQHFLIIFFTADLWWGLQGKERKLLECWEWECQKYSPYAHWGQNLQKKFALFVPMSAVKSLGVTKGCLLTRQTWLWWKSHPCCPSRAVMAPDLPSALATLAQSCLPPSTLQCSLQGKALPKDLPQVRMGTPTPCLFSLPGPQHHQLPAAVKCQKLNLCRYGSNSSLCHTKN